MARHAGATGRPGRCRGRPRGDRLVGGNSGRDARPGRRAPPLSYLLAGLKPGESRTFDGRMEVYSSKDPSVRWCGGRIRATTVYAGVYQVRTPAGSFRSTLIRTDYRIDIFAVVSVRDTLYTFYADGVGKVAEAEHRRISAVGLFNSDTHIGKVLVSYTSISVPPRIEAP